MDRIILAFASEKAHAQITRILGSGGLAPSISCFSGAETIRAARKLGGAVVICGFRLRDMTAEMLAVDLTASPRCWSSPLPGIWSCVGTGISSSWPSPPPGRSSSPRWIWPGSPCRRRPGSPASYPAKCRGGAADLRAKAVLMEVNLMSEAEAHRFLQKYSMDTGLRLAETARLILERYTTG